MNTKNVAPATYPSLKDRAVLISGGASGIGADIVRAFNAQGARVAFVDIQDDVAAELVDECENRPLFRHCDVTDVDAVKSVYAEISNEIGPISVMVNNAANDKRVDLDDVDETAWNDALNINLSHYFFFAQATKNDMIKLGGGAIINLSSIAFRFGPANLTAYAAAKAGIIGMTKSLGTALGKHHIRVNAIEPGAVMTKRQRELWYRTEDEVEAIVSRQTLPGILHGESIANMAVFLASDEAKMITKQTFAVDAGLY